MEKALRESESRFRETADHAPMMIWVAERDGSCSFLNRRWYEFTGQTLVEGQGHGWEASVHPDDLPLARQALAAASARQEAFRLEYRVWHRDGDYRWVLDSAVPRFGAEGEFLGFVGSLIDVTMVVDVTEEKRTEEALRSSERLYRAIGESIDFGVWICDAEGRNLYASESFLALVGMTQEECSNFGWGEVLHPDDVEATLAAWQECVKSGEKWDVEHRFHGVDGAWHPILARGVPVRDAQGEIIAWAGINLDIARLKQVEDELREAHHRKDEFLATLAHELRNPLAPIRTSLEILRLKDEGGPTSQRVHAMIERQVNHMIRLVDDLLEVSRITRGKIELRRERVAIASVIRSALETSRPMIDAARHLLTVTLPPVPLHLEADAVRLAQVFANLLSNAAKYTPEGGRIDVRVERCGEDVVVSVQDTGAGIPDDHLEKVFDLFIQGEWTAGRAQGGLGIGLTLVRQLVELHGGRVEARSPGPGQGSAFVVTLPLAPGLASDAGAAAHPLLSKLAPQRVLVVDDNRDAAESLGILLGILGMNVHLVHDGPAALAAIPAFRPAVVLLDLGMPGMDGFEVARRVRCDPEAKGLLVVAVTGWGQPEDLRRSHEAGFNHHLVKPVDLEALRAVLASQGLPESSS